MVVLGVGAAAAATFAQSAVYAADLKLVVGQGGGLPQAEFGRDVQTFTATMADLVQSQIVARRVLSRVGGGEQPDELLRRVSVSINPETAVVDVTVRDHSKARAAQLATALGNAFSALVRERFRSVPQPNPASAPISVTVFDPAHARPDPVSPKPLRNLVLAAGLGLVLGVTAAFVRDRLDRRLRTRQGVERALGVPVLGTMPSAGEDGGASSAWLEPMAESMSAIRAKLRHLDARQPLRRILVTSGAADEGKSELTANLARALAQSGLRVVAVESDLRRPRLAGALGVDRPAAGLTNVLTEGMPVRDALIWAPLTPRRWGSAEAVALLAAGPRATHPTELLSGPRMSETMEALAADFDYVIVEAPPLLTVADGLETARQVDGVVLAVRRGGTRRDEAQELRALTERLEIRVVGAVLTGDDSPPASNGRATSRPSVDELTAAGTREP